MRFPDIKVGDQVIIDGRVIAQVERVTKTQFTANGRRFMRKGGYEYGGDYWHPQKAVPATPEQLEVATRRMEEDRMCSTANSLLIRLGTILQAIGRKNPSGVAAAIPHLEAALAAMRGDTLTDLTTPTEQPRR